MDDDIFGSALGLEETHYNEGYEEGITAGRRVGRLEGRALGLQKGFEIGHEIGYYSGCVQIWKQAKSPNVKTPRAEKAIAALEDSIALFPLDNPRDERIQDLMDTIRGKYKLAISILGFSEQQSGEIASSVVQQHFSDHGETAEVASRERDGISLPHSQQRQSLEF